MARATVSNGSTGRDAFDAQRALNATHIALLVAGGPGLAGAPLREDSNFGPHSVQVLNSFKDTNSLPMDGTADDDTWALLEPNLPSDPAPPNALLSYGVPSASVLRGFTPGGHGGIDVAPTGSGSGDVDDPRRGVPVLLVLIKWLVERRQQLLLVVASEIFAGMTGDRYRFAADFTIIDGRTGIARNPRTLSGGEGFMASLSLALGMAEIAARSGGRIGSLYLDEGFGALDPNALDEAITALELRARNGQMILIVSHVPAIAQRIERILQVRPDPTGSSAEWLDDEDRESLLVEAATVEV
jgi:hypothetical protein